MMMMMMMMMMVKLYPEAGKVLTSHRAFTVDYERGKDTELREHYDDAEITLNVCLGTEDFKGGDLIFFDGVRGFKAKEESSVKKYLRIKHKIGNAVIHLGSGIHRALHITGGRRVNLIVWCINPVYRMRMGCALCRRTERHTLASRAEPADATETKNRIEKLTLKDSS
mmetsp:Transcript_20713/g.33395  ORF Transcript_20713/g.33395 Transcript_20713/m.33395 type:complete len:168 (-) Transcript_20713:25-528(-)